MPTAPALSLWDVVPSPPARCGEVTQQAAARAVAVRAPAMRERVFSYIRARLDGATNEEISNELKMKIQTVCGRVAELREAGRIAWRGETRDTAAGVKAKVWRVCE